MDASTAPNAAIVPINSRLFLIGVRFTPTLQFLPEHAAGLGARKPRDREVARAQGYLEPKHFLAMFKFFSERAYEKGNLRDYLKANS